MALHETFRISDTVPQKMAGRLQGLRRRSRFILYGLGILVLLLLASCSSRQSLFVVLPNPDGSSGAVTS